MSSVTNEKLIFSSLIKNKDYFVKVIPHIKTEYFEPSYQKFIFNAIRFYAEKYDKQPNFLVLENLVESKANEKLNEKEKEEALEFIKEIKQYDIPDNLEYLVDEAESFCRDRALYNAVATAIDVYQGVNKNIPREMLHEIVRDAQAITFDESLGLDFDEDAEARYERYISKEKRQPFEFDILNDITNGGVAKKTLNIIAAGVNVGKSMTLVWLAAMYKRLGYNVLYVSNEMSEDEVMLRIDASMLDIETFLIDKMGKDKFVSRIHKLKELNHGRLKVKEYATGTCNSNKIRSLLKDYKLKYGFVPDVIINDYLTINQSSHIKYTGNMGDYYTKVAEEQRAIMVDFNCIGWTAAQMVTDAMESTDPSISDLGMSQGIAKTADLIWAVARTEELDRIGQILFKQLKTRYHHEKIKRWTMGISIPKQKFFEVEQVMQNNIVNTAQLPKTDGEDLRPKEEVKTGKKQLSFN